MQNHLQLWHDDPVFELFPGAGKHGQMSNEDFSFQ
jgi:hypothetical protein